MNVTHQLKLFLFISILSSTSIAYSQNYQTIEEVNDACSQLGFNSDEDAEIAVDRILDEIGLFRNFTIQECPNINNAVAKNIEISPGQKERYILYDANFFDRIEEKANNRWAAISVLAHEIGHHLNGHSLNNEGSNHKFELEADYFSGLALAKMGASKEEAQSAIMTIKYEKATSTHPAKKDRLIAIENGWNKAKGITNVKTVEEENEDIAFDLYRKGEKSFENHDFSKALQFFDKAKSLGYKDAYYYLSHIYYTGLSVKVDYKKAYTYAKEGYDLGSIPATYQLGKYLANGTGVTKNKTEANRLFQKEYQIKWFKDQYSKYKTPFHAYAIGYMYSEGYGGVQKDEEIAVMWYKHAAVSGSLTAIGNLGVLYEEGNGISKDIIEAVKYYRKAAELGHVNSMTNLGSKYRAGEGVTKNIETCIYWYEKALENGSPEAMVKLGSMYIKGEEIEQDITLGLSYYEMGLAYKTSLYGDIGNYYFNNFNRQKAYEYYKLGADLNDVTSMSNLGLCYDGGYGTETNWEKAVYYYKKAAAQGSAFSMRNLGEFYYFGVGGLSQDTYKAKRLFQEAADLGNDLAKTYLKVIKHIENRDYVMVSNSNYDNRLYITEEEIAEEYPAYPYVYDNYYGNWVLKVNYQFGSNTRAVQIFPITQETEDNDELYFKNYSPCAPLYKPNGSHDVSIRNVDSNGYRAIKYLYYQGIFHLDSGKDKVMIKAPVALCWVPKEKTID
ncbi:SEL1-like repeat protein [Lacinutrix sp. C3R15]|uniref:SEL1-like repeat protein n=1 Tax=Flavobacteriaceae TaxID=49546 RepID=UPI001C09B059|nr:MULTISPECIES: SEL1-like repeat protein [Flavobacteriaceae]MBU2938561.1 SEL1-like repeat protein [Lacinutrix sp. C3R15]MDO6621875.1 SEL1-like repeat protein [Oceanihabitans sp. 1_MG-2023]